MKHCLLVLTCIVCFSLAGAAQTAVGDTGGHCCNQKKEKLQPPIVVTQAEGQKITAIVKQNVQKQRLHFYLFDLEGTMVHQSTLDCKERNTVAEVKKGTYIYTVFANDESIDEGRITVK